MTTRTTLDRDRDTPPVICSTTGLALRPVAGEAFFRIAKPSYGAMNPPERSPSGDRKEWGRFDVAGERTLYGAAPEEAAYAESLASFRIAKDVSDTKAHDVFDTESFRSGRKTLQALIQDEWRERNHMSSAQLPAGWRDERLMYELVLPTSGWLVDITAFSKHRGAE